MTPRYRIRNKPRSGAHARRPACLRAGPLLVAIVLVLAQFPASRAAIAQDDPVDEYQLKAALLYHLSQFVEWPDSGRANRHAPLFVCILGQDPFANSLINSMPKETDTGRPMIVRQLARDTPISGCHILYISSSERKSADHIFMSLDGSGVLTVGEMTQFAARGGIVQFNLGDRRVRFDINLGAASRSGLKISSKLLALAQIVRD
jgi:hypothetical protein